MYMINPKGIEHGVIRLEDRAWIPASVDNRDWQQFLEWQAQGNEPVEWAENYGEEAAE